MIMVAVTNNDMDTPLAKQRSKDLFCLYDKNRLKFEEELPSYYISNYCYPYHLVELYDHAKKHRLDSLLKSVVRAYLSKDYEHPLLDEALATYYINNSDVKTAINL